MISSHNRQYVSVVLLAALLAGTVSCGSGAPSADTTAPAGDTSAAETEEEDPLAGLDFGGKTIRIVYNKAKSGGNDEFVSEESGDVQDDAVFARNLKIEEDLNVKLEFIPIVESNVTTYYNNLHTQLMAGEDTYDIISGVQWHLVKLPPENMLYDLMDAPYLDYSKSCWAVNYMDTIAVNQKHRYLLCGDISKTLVSSMGCTFFNKTLYEDFFGDPNDLYKLVLDGRWTFETMEEYVKKGWKDLDGDGVCGVNDIIGNATTASSPTEHFAYPAGMKFVSRDKDGFPVLLTDQTHNVEVTEKLYHLLFENEGTFVHSDANVVNNEYPVMFANGTILFFPNLIDATDKFRDAKDPYGIIPRPKFDENQKDYMSLVHDYAVLFGIPVTSKDIDASCAVLEAMCEENYKTVMPAYYEVALKVKYTHDDISAQIVDLIHDSAMTDFIYANNYVLGSSGSLGTIQRKLMGARSKDFMSTYDSMKSALSTVLDSLIEQEKSKG